MKAKSALLKVLELKIRIRILRYGLTYLNDILIRMRISNKIRTLILYSEIFKDTVSFHLHQSAPIFTFASQRKRRLLKSRVMRSVQPWGMVADATRLGRCPTVQMKDDSALLNVLPYLMHIHMPSLNSSTLKRALSAFV